MAVSPSRASAFDILLRVERENSYASELLHSSLYQGLSNPDHALTTELVMGVLRWRSRLDAEITDVSSQPLSKLDLEVLLALRLALYQFRWLDRVPHRASLHESVELVKRARKRSAVPFVNAILRKLSVRAGSKDLRDERHSSASALANGLAHPDWLVERWANYYGLVAAEQICVFNQAVPQTAVRLRSLEAEAKLEQAGVPIKPGAILSTARRLGSHEVPNIQALLKQQIVIQYEGSQLVAALVGGEMSEGSRILDCCAAPGGKTLALADRHPFAQISAVEIYPHRARLLRQLTSQNQKDSSSRIEIVVADATNFPFTHQFARILADVPCSGTGTLARHPEIKWRLTKDTINQLQKLQLAILESALDLLAPGGSLIYSTCSLEKEENEDVVELALGKRTGVRLVPCAPRLEELQREGLLTLPDIASLTRGPYLRTIPGLHPCDGFFAAILQRV
jgi:16S rRNA (cytosine967-C5)-methyltransferase